MVFTPLLSQTSPAHMVSAVIVAKPRALPGPPCPTWRWRDGYSVLLDVSSMPQCSWPVSGNLPPPPAALTTPRIGSPRNLRHRAPVWWPLSASPQPVSSTEPAEGRELTGQSIGSRACLARVPAAQLPAVWFWANHLPRGLISSPEDPTIQVPR